MDRQNPFASILWSTIMAGLLNHWLSVTLFVPLVGVLTVAFWARNQPTVARPVALATTMVALLSTLPLWFIYDPDGKTWQFAERFNLVASLGLSLYFGVDGTSLLLLVLAPAIAAAAVLASWKETATRAREFYALLLLVQAGITGVLVALDLVVFFVSWQITLASLYLLVRRWGSSVGPSRFLHGCIGVGIVMGAGMVILYLANPGGTSPYSSDITLLHTRTLTPALQSWVFIAFLLAFGATMSLVPLHGWMVDAQTTAPSTVSVLIAALLTKLGAYGIFRLLLPVAPDACRQAAPLVAGVAVAGVLSGAFLAWRQQNYQRRLAYATVSQMSVMMLALFALTPAGIGISVTQQIGHGFWIAALLLCGAIVSWTLEGREISAFDGVWERMPAVAALFGLTSAAAAGVFSVGGLLDEASGLRGGLTGNPRWALLVLGGLLVSLLYLLPLLRRTFISQSVPGSDLPHGATRLEIALVGVLALAAATVGLYPAPILRRIETSVGRVVARIHPEMTPYLRLGSDCPTAAPPDPAGPPPGFILVQPCAEGEAPRR
jgi:NADH-quinone oxidoreductase subunit M